MNIIESDSEGDQITAQGTRASWQFSTDTIRQNTASYPEDAQTALIALFMWCNDPRHPLSKPDAARRLGTSDNLLYKLYTGKYRAPDGTQLHPSPDLVRAIKHFIELEKERFEAGETSFVRTPTYEGKIVRTCNLVRESNTIGFIWGPSHIGKTWGLVHYTSANNHGRTVYTRLQAASGLGGMVRRIASDCGISDKSNTADLVHRIKNALTRDMLLIIDECHLLAHTYRRSSFHNCCEVIRELYDETLCPTLLCWTDIDNVKAASQKELQQLWRRAVHKVPLPIMPTKADLTAILNHAGLQFPDPGLVISIGKTTDKPYDVIRQLAKLEGLKAITERLRYGRKLAKKTGDKLTWSHVMDAHFRIAKQAVQEGEWQ